MNRIDLITEILIKEGLKTGVEVGSFKGEYAKEILKRWDGNLYMVDVWDEMGSEYIDASNHKNFNNQVYIDCFNNIQEFGLRATMIRTNSEMGSKLFTDESVDFVYIDANHAYDFVKDDIEYWFPKVKKGGYIMGHDYIDLDWYNDPHFAKNGKDKHIWSDSGRYYHGVFGVNPAVDEFCETNNYKVNLTNEWFGTWYFKK